VYVAEDKSFGTLCIVIRVTVPDTSRDYSTLDCLALKMKALRSLEMLTTPVTLHHIREDLNLCGRIVVIRAPTISDHTEAVKMCGPYNLHILYATAKKISKYKIGNKSKYFPGELTVRQLKATWRKHFHSAIGILECIAAPVCRNTTPVITVNLVRTWI